MSSLQPQALYCVLEIMLKHLLKCFVPCHGRYVGHDDRTALAVAEGHSSKENPREQVDHWLKRQVVASQTRGRSYYTTFSLVLDPPL